MGLGMQVESVTGLDVTVLEAVIDTGGVMARVALARPLLAPAIESAASFAR